MDRPQKKRDSRVVARNDGAQSGSARESFFLARDGAPTTVTFTSTIPTPLSQYWETRFVSAGVSVCITSLSF